MTLDLDRRAAHWGDRVALVDHDTTVSYAELDRRADVAASRLAEAGVGPGDAVLVLARNRPETLALLWAVRRRGATLAPVSHRLPADRIGALADRIDPALALCEERFTDLLADVDAPARDVDGIDDPGSTGDGTDAADPTSDGGPPLYLHTGGTTGVPKVVELTERQLEWNAITEVAAWGLGNDEVIPLLLPLFHTGGWNLLTLPTLYVGGTVVVRREFDPGAALATIEEYGATRAFGVAAIFRAMADHEDFDETDLSSLEWCMSGGGPTPTAVMDAYRERGVPFTQGYGLTEGGPNNLYVDPGRPDARKADESVGRPFPDCEARIVDEDGTPLPAGEVGELELRGPVTARSYLDTEDGTFADETWEGGAGESSTGDAALPGPWVSTGDLARRDDEGDYYVEGRVDNAFVSGGETVHPEAIEDALEAHPDVAAAGVVPIAHEQWGQVPKAVVEPDADADPDVGALASHAEAELAGFEVPHEFVVDDLPRSGPGKLDRGALADQYGDERRDRERPEHGADRSDQGDERHGDGPRQRDDGGERR